LLLLAQQAATAAVAEAAAATAVPQASVSLLLLLQPLGYNHKKCCGTGRRMQAIKALKHTMSCTRTS
jgi:hypothetical protein